MMFAAIEWKWDELGLIHYIALGGGGVLVLALVLYCIPSVRRGGLRVPAILVAVLAALAVGVAGGALGAAWFGDPNAKDKPADDNAGGQDARRGMGAMGGMGGMGGGMGGMPGGMGGMP